MSRILTGALIVAAVLAMNGLFLRDTMAGETALSAGPVTTNDARGSAPIGPPSRILELLISLETLHVAASADRSKV